MKTSQQAGRVLHASRDGVHTLRLIGEIRHTLGPALDLFLKRLVEQRPRHLVIALGETRIIDSTCLGVLARMALRLRAQGLARARVVSPRMDITELLRSMSFDRLFDIVGDMPSAPLQEQELETQDAGDDAALLTTMLDAHRTLMALSEHNRLQFRDVVGILEQESAARSARHA